MIKIKLNSVLIGLKFVTYKERQSFLKILHAVNVKSSNEVVGELAIPSSNDAIPFLHGGFV
jgi:hypothetical protein